MIKKILLPLYLIAVGIIVYLLVTKTIYRTTYFLEEIMRSDIYSPFLNNSLRNLAPIEIKNLQLSYKIELTQLENLKSSTIALISLCGILIIAFTFFKRDFSVKKFDGVTVMATYFLLICTIFTIFKIFIDDKFKEGNNATIEIRSLIEVILLIMAPLIFFTVQKINKLEISKNMHEAKWITNLAIVLTVLSGLLALFFGIAVLFTPDVSKFTS
jgi:amino acid transporter